MRHARGARHCHLGRERGLAALVSALLSSAALTLLPQQAQAQSAWQGATSDYNTNGNWDNNTAPVSSGQSAIFSGTGSTKVTVSSAVSPDSWAFNTSSQSYNIGGSAVTFGTATGIVDSASGHTISIANDLGGVAGVAAHDVTGMLQLTGNNSYSGGAVIDSGATLTAGPANAFSASSDFSVNGTLDLAGFNNGIGSLSGSGIVTNNGGTTATLTDGGDNASTTYSGILQDGAHALALTVAGTGTLTLSGSNSYSGLTTINNGATPQVGNGGTTGSLDSGNVTNNGSLIFDIFATAPASNAISGSGSVTVSGNHLLVLRGANTHTGGATIIAGSALQIGLGDTSGSIAGNVLDNGVLSFNRIDSISFSGNISGSGQLTQGGGPSYVNAGTSFAVLGTALAQDTAALQAGFDLRIAPSTTLSTSYDTFSPTVPNHAFRGDVSWHF